MLRVSLISGAFFPPDAMSYSLTCKVEALHRLYGEDFEYRVFAQYGNPTISNFVLVRGIADLARDSFFVDSDLICYEFGIYYEIFNSVFLLSTKTTKLAIYHNITPEHLLTNEVQKIAVWRALRQKANLIQCDFILADSHYNRDDLITFGIRPEKIGVLNLPLPFGFDGIACRVAPVGEFVELLFVGRFVSSKGVLDLIAAVTQLLRDGFRNIRLSMVGDARFSDPDYVKAIHRAVEASGRSGNFRFVGGVDAEELIRQYKAAHIVIIPSYHEGYCLPVLEAFSTGCLVVTYDAGNLPSITGGLGRLVPSGNINELARTIAELVSSLTAPVDDSGKALVPLDRGVLSIDQYTHEVTEYLQHFSFNSYCDHLGLALKRLGIECPSVASPPSRQ
jgi:glycosyltransferase involved in cell wall biosynthesis